MRVRLQNLIAQCCITVALPMALMACGGGGGGDPLQNSGPPAGPSPIGMDPPPIVETPPVTGGVPASLAIGQEDLQSSAPNLSRPISDRTLDSPRGIAVTRDGELFIADTGTNRVLRFASVPGSSGRAADDVLGQPGFDTQDPATSREGMFRPYGIAVGAGKMAVTEFGNNRVLIYDPIPVDGDAIPVAVLGQQDFDSSVRACSETGMSSPAGVTITPLGKLIVADTFNHRVLIWNRLPAVSNTAPDLILGQDAPTNCTYNDFDQDGQPDVDGQSGREVASASTFGAPADVWSDDTRLVVADVANHRVLIWNDFPTGSLQAASVVVGHANVTDMLPNSERDEVGTLPRPTAATLVNPSGIHSDGTALAVADSLNHRVLIWNIFPTENLTPADTVLGHASFDRSVSNDLDMNGEPDAATGRVLHTPSRVLFAGGSLLVSDRLHNRVLVFPRWPGDR